MKIKNMFMLLSLGLSLTAASQDDKRMAVLFEEKYQDWQKWTQEHSFSSDLTGNKPYKEMIKLGVDALPYMIDKMEKNPNDFHLAYAVQQISRKVMEKDDYPEGKLGDSVTASKYYVKWWKDGRKNSKNDFEKLYNEWKKSSNATDKEAKYIKLRNLGIIILPEVVDKIKQGDKDLLPMFSCLTNCKIKNDISGENYLSWWEKNKGAYEAISK